MYFDLRFLKFAKTDIVELKHMHLHLILMYFISFQVHPGTSSKMAVALRTGKTGNRLAHYSFLYIHLKINPKFQTLMSILGMVIHLAFE